MLALFGVFEYLSNVRRLLGRFQAFYSAPATVNTDEQISSNVISTSSEPSPQQCNILLGPVLNNILKDNRLNYFDEEFQEDLQRDEYFARELDACLLEMRDIERDLLNLKRRQCYFYEQYVDFIEQKDQLIDQFIEYYDQYLLNKSNQSRSSSPQQLRTGSIDYEFSVPVSNRFELFKWQHTQDFE
ncbi:unnamed protein product [Rotaria socialis]|uniref:Uncharacterized protein n=1 Tax=Rotaria socialis TaxID=392032 RepID=A0A817YX08_9BILA|nr:unnamed protein product [Rotaria socialis]CAF3387319.1 unnamed protein product [Rotaria socialis]CAF3476782.1 unnamed protein product [Rotaria socialis]CAF3506880.1 unnamed protein product [Rotaria socialis]CAF3766041.1 unnamed protein product [Rotaria socialis]